MLAKSVVVDWRVTAVADRALSFTINSDKAATENWGQTSFLEYSLSGTTLSIIIKNSAKEFPTVITVDTTTKAGSILYDDGATKGCWDAAGADTACPTA